MIKKLLLYGSIAGGIGAIITIYSLTVQNNKIKADRATMEQHYEAQIEILKHPKEKKDEQREVTRIVYIDKKGDEVIVEKEVVRVVTEKEPVILDRPTISTALARRWYISGAYGATHSGFGFGVGVGYSIFSFVDVGLRYDTIDGNGRAAIETTIRF